MLSICSLVLQFGQRLLGIIPVEILRPSAAPQSVLHFLILMTSAVQLQNLASKSSTERFTYLQFLGLAAFLFPNIWVTCLRKPNPLQVLIVLLPFSYEFGDGLCRRFAFVAPASWIISGVIRLPPTSRNLISYDSPFQHR
jgi:hypothetical protein